MKKIRNLKKYIIIVAVFLTAMLTFAGSATWLILTEVEQTLENLSTLDAMTIEYTPKNATAMYYGDTVGYTATGEKVYYKIGNTQQEIEGTWLFDIDKDGVYESTIDSIMASASTAEDWFTVSADGTYYNLSLTRSAKFTLNDNALSDFIFREDYVVPQVTLKVPMLAVALYEGTYYTTMDSVMADIQEASSGTVYALSSDNKNEARAKVAKTITKATTIPKGVRLSIPYEGEPTVLPDDKTYFISKSSKKNGYNTPANCTNIVTLSNELKVNGTLCIYGACVAGAGANFAGNVDGKFGKLTFSGDLASIQAENGSNLYVYGYIESNDTNHEKFCVNSGAKLFMPFTLYEWRGGTITSDIVSEMTPFLRFTVSNVVGAYRIKYGATITVQTAVHIKATLGSITLVDDTFTAATDLISTADAAFMQLKTSSGYVDIHYSAEPIDGKYGKNTWNVYGGGQMNSIDITLYTYSLSTKGQYLPVSYLMDISLFDGEYSLINQDVKVFPGAVITIGSGATVTAAKMIVYSQVPVLGGNFPAFPADVKKGRVEIANGGKLIINDGVGGEINAVDSGGEIVVADSASTTLSSKEYDASKERITYTETLSLPKYSNALESYSTAGTYYSTQITDVDTEYTHGWYPKDFSVSLNAKGGSVSTDVISSEAVPGKGIRRADLPTPTRIYHTFDHWCTETSCAGGDACPCPDVLYEGGNTLNAIWKAHEFNIKYVITVDGQPTSESGTLTPEPFTIPRADVANTALPEPEKADLTEDGNIFVGWSVRSGAATADFSFTPAYLVNGAVQNADGVYERTIYGVWITKPHTLSFAFGNNPYNTQLQVTQVTDAAANYYPDTDQIIPTDILNFDTNIEKTYYFNGWYAKNANNEDVEYVQGVSKLSDFADADGNVTLYAMWDTKYALTLEGSSGDTNQPNQKVDAKTYYFLESQLSEALSAFDSIYQAAGQYNTDPTVSKYFAGWTELPAEFDANKTKTFNANWRDKVKVTYNANEGTCGTTAHWYYEGTDLKLPTATRGEHYEFLGWYTAVSDGSWIGNAGDSYEPDANITLYARWQGYTVTYDPNKGSVSPTSATYEGTALTLPLPERTGHTFIGWYTAKTDGTKIGDAGASYTPTANITLYAQWKENLKVTYNANGGTCAIASAEYTGTPLLLPTATRAGYTFLGWYTAASGGSKIEGTSYSPTDNITLYAHWQKEYTVTYKANGGTCSISTQLYTGDALTLPTPTRTGYKCTGWYTAESGGSKAADAGASYAPTEDITLYAQWEKVAYTITVETNNATITGVSNGQTAYYGDTITVTVSFSKTEGKKLTVTDTSGSTILNETADGTYTFTMPASNVTISASSRDPSCVTTGSLITLADGIQKRIEDLTYNDMLLVWDFFKGEYAAVPASVIVFHGDAYYDVVTLIFSDGTEVRTVGAHDFFDVAANEFVSINKSNVASFVGHDFIKTDGNGYSTVTLVDYTIVNEYTGSYSILSAYHNNFIVENMLSLTPLLAIGADRFCEYFEVGEGMKYDEEKMQADIEKYGLYTYEDFADYLTYEQYLALNAPYYKVLVEQGYVTFDDLLKAILLYVK